MICIYAHAVESAGRGGPLKSVDVKRKEEEQWDRGGWRWSRKREEVQRDDLLMLMNQGSSELRLTVV